MVIILHYPFYIYYNFFEKIPTTYGRRSAFFGAIFYYLNSASIVSFCAMQKNVSIPMLNRINVLYAIAYFIFAWSFYLNANRREKIIEMINRYKRKPLLNIYFAIFFILGLYCFIY
jgi:hypothetical protein